MIGLSLWILILNILGYFLYKSILINGTTFHSRLNVALSAIILLIYLLPTIHGRIVLSTVQPESVIRNQQSAVTVGMIQSNVDPWEKWTKSSFETVELYMKMTDDLVRSHPEKRPDVVLWPETAMPYAILIPQNRPTLNLIRQKLDAVGV